MPSFETHPSLSSNHGFFGRQGGISGGVYASLNAGLTSGDDPNNVATNRSRISTELGADHLISLAQVHSAKAVIIDTPPNATIEADGIVTTMCGLAISALTADCGPVLLEDAESGVVAACHAGWRGALSGIVEATLSAMVECGARPKRISAVLGPCISLENYEVGDDFRQTFLAEDHAHDYFFKPGPTGTPHFDLPAFILSKLQAAGVKSAFWTGQCTYADRDRYFSYRRNTHEGLAGYGRNISAIMRSQ